jgi:hypothetical protein
MPDFHNCAKGLNDDLCAPPRADGRLENPPPTFNLVSGTTILDRREIREYFQSAN